MPVLISMQYFFKKIEILTCIFFNIDHKIWILRMMTKNGPRTANTGMKVYQSGTYNLSKASHMYLN